MKKTFANPEVMVYTIVSEDVLADASALFAAKFADVFNYNRITSLDPTALVVEDGTFVD